MTRLIELEKIIKQTEANGINFRKYLKIKNLVREYNNQVTGILNSSNWQSPSLGKDIKNRGEMQLEYNSYMRTQGSKYLPYRESIYLKSFFDFSQRTSYSTGHFTCSGMKGLEVALLFVRSLYPNIYLHYHEGFYFEGIGLIDLLFENKKRVNNTEIFSLLEEEDLFSCLVLDPGGNWPEYDSIELNKFFESLINIKSNRQIFIIIDKTVLPMCDQLFIAILDQLPSNIILILFESSIKYYQLGMDILNLGFIYFHGSLIRRERVRNLINHILKISSAIPDPNLLVKLPKFESSLISNRLQRIARNKDIILAFLRYLKRTGIVNGIYGISKKNSYYIEESLWNGSLIYITFKNIESIEEHEKLIFKIYNKSPRHLNLQIGNSFGMDLTRLCLVADFYKENKPAIRISVGKESITSLYQKLFFIEKLIKE